MFKNTAGQQIRVFAFNRTTAEPVTGGAANITCKVSLDGAAAVALADTNPTETEDGYYLFSLTQAETNGDTVDFYPESSTSGVQVIVPSYDRHTRAEVSTAAAGSSYSVASESVEGLPRAELVAGSAVDLVTAAQLRAQLNIPDTDTTHDTQLAFLANVAREQIEVDTGRYVTSQTWRIKLPHFLEFQFCQRPVTAIDSITYFDSSNTQQTLAASSYELDTGRDHLILHSPPITYDRFDAVTVNYSVGGFATTEAVPYLYKHACLLLVAHYFENPDMMVSVAHQGMTAYHRIIANILRASYP